MDKDTKQRISSLRAILSSTDMDILELFFTSKGGENALELQDINRNIPNIKDGTLYQHLAKLMSLNILYNAQSDGARIAQYIVNPDIDAWIFQVLKLIFRE